MTDATAHEARDAAAAARGDDARAARARARLGRAGGARREPASVALLRGGARRRSAARRQYFEEELFGPAEGLHSTFRMMRDELLDTVSRTGGSLAEMRLDTYLDVTTAVARYFELLKLAALIERQKGGQPLSRGAARGERPAAADRHARAARDVPAELRSTTTCATPSATSGGAKRRSRHATSPRSRPFIPRRGDGLMLSASDIETYRLCPLKYKFARVFRIPQEPTINQRFGIVVHQVLERYHQQGGGSLDGADGAVRCRVAAQRLRRLERRPAVPRARRRRARALLGARPRARGRAGVVRALVLVQARPAPAARASGPRGPAAGRRLRADRLQDRPAEDRAGPARGHAALALPDGCARVVGPRDLGAELLLRARQREGAGGALRRGARPRARHGGPRSPRHPVRRSSSRRPRYEICSFCDYRIICPAAEK